ncbi:MAG: molybdopterin-binding protein, partial [Acidimicrobiales bacterium]
RDLVPGALESLGVRRIFHKVRLKPGKPIWFGVGGRRQADGEPEPAPSRPGPLVFGLPGNPVSGVVGYLLFVRPALKVLTKTSPAPNSLIGRLSRPFRHRGERPTYHPARLEIVAGGEPPRVELLDWAGSADLLTVARADGFAAFSAGDRDYEAGSAVEFLPSSPNFRPSP